MFFFLTLGNFGNSSNYNWCTACHPDCKTSFGANNTNCLSCADPTKYLLNYTCVDGCPNKMCKNYNY